MLALMLLASISSMGYANQSSNQSKGGGSGSSGPTMKPKQVSGKEVKDQQVNMQANRTPREHVTRNVRKHPLAAPTKFIKDGVYVWCDPDGLWTIFWKTRQKQTVKTTVTTGKLVRIKSAVKSKIKKLGTQSNSLEIFSDPNSGIGIVQFTSTDDSIQYDILFNGKADPNSVYIGSLLNNPTQFPLKLDTRRLSHEASMGTKMVKSEKSPGATGLKASVMAAPHGGGGSGGNKAGKAKKLNR